MEGKWQKNLGQFISLKNQSKNREIDLDTPIKKNLANGDRVKIDFKIKPASFETSANQKGGFWMGVKGRGEEKREGKERGRRGKRGEGGKKEKKE